MSLYSTHLSEPDLSSISPRSSVVITPPSQSEVCVALEDHVTDGDQSEQCIMSLVKGEKVEVLCKSDSGKIPTSVIYNFDVILYFKHELLNRYKLRSAAIPRQTIRWI